MFQVEAYRKIMYDQKLEVLELIQSIIDNVLLEALPNAIISKVLAVLSGDSTALMSKEQVDESQKNFWDNLKSNGMTQNDLNKLDDLGVDIGDLTFSECETI